MQLSNRLTTVAQFVTKGNRVADIGCDHAHTSIYLVEKEIAVSSIAMDINKGPLERAKENIRRYQYEDKITTRLSDGAKELKVGEVDTLLMSGMGGLLVNKILSDSIEVVKEVKELILQPQSEIALVRKYIYELGFFIEKEAMLIEDEKYYTVIKAVRADILDGRIDVVKENEMDRKQIQYCMENQEKNSFKEPYEKEIFYRYGKTLLEEKNLVLKQFLEYGKHSYEEILKEISRNLSEKTQIRCKELQEELKYIEEALEYYNEKNV